MRTAFHQDSNAMKHLGHARGIKITALYKMSDSRSFSNLTRIGLKQFSYPTLASPLTNITKQYI